MPGAVLVTVMKVWIRMRRQVMVVLIAIVIAVMPDTVRLMVVVTVHLTPVSRPSETGCRIK